MWLCTSEKDAFIRTFQATQARTAPQVLRPGTTHRYYAMVWSHAYGRSTGYLRVLWSRGCKIPYVYLIGSVRFKCGYPRGPCGFHTDMGSSVRSGLREPYGPMWMTCDLEMPIRSVVQGLTRSGETHECKLGLYLPSQTRLCDIWPVLYMLNLQPRDIRHNSKFFETSLGLAMHAIWFPTCLHRRGPYGARRLSESFMWPRHKLPNA